jgi:hypothetical protein
VSLVGSSLPFLQRFSSFTRGRVRHTKRYSACGVCSAHEWSLLYDATHAPYLLFLSGVLPFLKAGHMRFVVIFMNYRLSGSVFKCLFHRPLKRDRPLRDFSMISILEESLHFCCFLFGPAALS